MDKCRHDNLSDHIDVTCYDCGTQDADIIADFRAQRDAAEKRAAQAEAEVERQKAAVDKLLVETLARCVGCACHDGCQCLNYTDCLARRRAWAYGETPKEDTTDATDD